MTLSELAEAATAIKGERLALVLTSVCNGGCTPFAWKWLLELLPRFHRLGVLCVRHERGRRKIDDRGCQCYHGPSCLEEGYDNSL